MGIPVAHCHPTLPLPPSFSPSLVSFRFEITWHFAPSLPPARRVMRQPEGAHPACDGAAARGADCAGALGLGGRAELARLAANSLSRACLLAQRELGAAEAGRRVAEAVAGADVQAEAKRRQRGGRKQAERHKNEPRLGIEVEVGEGVGSTWRAMARAVASRVGAARTRGGLRDAFARRRAERAGRREGSAGAHAGARSGGQGPTTAPKGTPNLDCPPDPATCRPTATPCGMGRRRGRTEVVSGVAVRCGDARGRGGRTTRGSTPVRRRWGRLSVHSSHPSTPSTHILVGAPSPGHPANPRVSTLALRLAALAIPAPPLPKLAPPWAEPHPPPWAGQPWGPAGRRAEAVRLRIAALPFFTLCRYDILAETHDGIKPQLHRACHCLG